MTAAPCSFSYNLQVKKYWSESLRLLKFSDFFQIQIALLFRSETEDFNTNCISPQAHCLNAYILQKFFLHTLLQRKTKEYDDSKIKLKLWVKCCKCAEENGGSRHASRHSARGGNSNFFSIIFVSFKNPNIGAFLKNGEE